VEGGGERGWGWGGSRGKVGRGGLWGSGRWYGGGGEGVSGVWSLRRKRIRASALVARRVDNPMRNKLGWSEREKKGRLKKGCSRQRNSEKHPPTHKRGLNRRERQENDREALDYLGSTRRALEGKRSSVYMDYRTRRFGSLKRVDARVKYYEKRESKILKYPLPKRTPKGGA